MPQGLGPSDLTGYDFTRIKAFGTTYFIQNPTNSPDIGDAIIWDGTGAIWSDITPDLSGYMLIPSGATDGDFLVYDQATDTWLPATVTEPYLSIFSAYDHTGTPSLAGVDIALDTEVEKDTDLYSHTAGTAGVTVLQTGLYYAQADITTLVATGAANSYVTVYFTQNGTEITGTRADIATITTGFRGSSTIGRMLSLTANDVIKLHADISGGSTVSAPADRTRMTLTTQIPGSIEVVTPTGPSFQFYTAVNSMYLPVI